MFSRTLLPCKTCTVTSGAEILSTACGKTVGKLLCKKRESKEQTEAVASSHFVSIPQYCLVTTTSYGSPLRVPSSQWFNHTLCVCILRCTVASKHTPFISAMHQTEHLPVYHYKQQFINTLVPFSTGSGSIAKPSGLIKGKQRLEQCLSVSAAAHGSSSVYLRVRRLPRGLRAPGGRACRRCEPWRWWSSPPTADLRWAEDSRERSGTRVRRSGRR